MSRGLGYKRDPHDIRDRKFAAHKLRADVISPFAVVDNSVRPKNQSFTSSCVGMATSQGLRLAYLAQEVSCPELSSMGVYRTARNIDGIEGDEGSYVRSALQAVSHLGVCSEGSWPFEPQLINAQLPFSALRGAYDRHGERSYYRIDNGNTDDCCRALGANCSVVAGWMVSQAFADGDGRSVVQAQAGLPAAGGHAICVAGYAPSDYFESMYPAFKADKHYPRLFLLVNSWGPSFGYNGRFFATPEFMAEATDVWALDVRRSA